MTCVVGVVDKGRGSVVLGSDSQSSSDWGKTYSATDKVFRVGPLVIGGCGSWRLLNILKHEVSVEAGAVPERDARLEEWLVCNFAEGIRELAQKRGLSRVESGEHALPGAVLIGVRGTLWEMDSDYQVQRNAHGYSAVGSGLPVALGALYATHRLDLPARQRAAMALQAASLHARGCGGRPKFIET